MKSRLKVCDPYFENYFISLNRAVNLNTPILRSGLIWPKFKGTGVAVKEWNRDPFALDNVTLHYFPIELTLRND